MPSVQIDRNLQAELQLVDSEVVTNPLIITGFWLKAAGAVTITLVDDEDVAVLPPIVMADGASIVAPYNPDGWAKSDAGLHISLSAAVRVYGGISYNAARP